jgi:hypothetical protein
VPLTGSSTIPSDRIVVGVSDFRVDIKFARRLFRRRSLRNLKIVVFRMKRNDESQFFHHTPSECRIKKNLSTIRAAQTIN